MVMNGVPPNRRIRWAKTACDSFVRRLCATTRAMRAGGPVLAISDPPRRGSAIVSDGSGWGCRMLTGRARSIWSSRQRRDVNGETTAPDHGMGIYEFTGAMAASLSYVPLPLLKNSASRGLPM